MSSVTVDLVIRLLFYEVTNGYIFVVRLYHVKVRKYLRAIAAPTFFTSEVFYYMEERHERGREGTAK